MMDENKKNKIDRFMRDEAMSQAVYEVLLNSFLTDKISQEVNVLAAARLSISFLKEGWKELSKYKSDDDKSPPQLHQVGL